MQGELDQVKFELEQFKIDEEKNTRNTQSQERYVQQTISDQQQMTIEYLNVDINRDLKHHSRQKSHQGTRNIERPMSVLPVRNTAAHKYNLSHKRAGSSYLHQKKMSKQFTSLHTHPFKEETDSASMATTQNQTHVHISNLHTQKQSADFGIKIKKGAFPKSFESSVQEMISGIEEQVAAIFKHYMGQIPYPTREQMMDPIN